MPTLPTLGFIVARAEAFVMLIGIIEGSSYTASSETHFDRDEIPLEFPECVVSLFPK